jgi:3-hydroxyisobutyrate dehydrogenase
LRRRSVAVLGLGRMGSAVARRLVERRFSVTVWNRTPERCEPLARMGATAGATLEEAVEGAEVVITVLSDRAALRAVVARVASTLAPGQTLIDMSTIGVGAITDVARALPADVSVVEAPVLGSIGEAQAGALTIFVGGNDEPVTDVLDALGTRVPIGPLGSAAAAKLVANNALFGALAALGESIALADHAGLPRETTFAVLSATPLAAQAERRRAAVIDRSFPPRFALGLARKDAELIAAATAGRELRVADAVLAWFRNAEARGAGERDYTAVLETIIDPWCEGVQAGQIPRLGPCPGPGSRPGESRRCRCPPP